MRFAGIAIVIFSLALIIGAARAATASADALANKCARCGAESCCLKKVCRAVPVEVEKKEVCFDCKCEDFCVPGRSIKCETKWHKDDCGCWVENVWKPTCAEMRTRNVIVKKEVTRKSQSFKWEVQKLCPACICLPPETPQAPGSGAPADEEIEEMQPEDQSVEEEEISALPPRSPAVIQVGQPAPAPRRSLWSFFR